MWKRLSFEKALSPSMRTTGWPFDRIWMVWHLQRCLEKNTGQTASWMPIVSPWPWKPAAIKDARDLLHHDLCALVWTAVELRGWLEWERPIQFFFCLRRPSGPAKGECRCANPSYIHVAYIAFQFNWTVSCFNSAALFQPQASPICPRNDEARWGVVGKERKPGGHKPVQFSNSYSYYYHTNYMDALYKSGTWHLCPFEIPMAPCCVTVHPMAIPWPNGGTKVTHRAGHGSFFMELHEKELQRWTPWRTRRPDIQFLSQIHRPLRVWYNLI